MSEMQKQEAASPLDARFPMFLGIIYGSYGNLQAAKGAFDQAHALSPTKQSIIYQQASVAKQLGNTDEYVSLLKGAYQELPENPDARALYINALIETHHEADADALIAPLIGGNATELQKAFQGYVQANNFKKIADIFAKRAVLMPTDLQTYFTWSVALAKSGDTKGAIAVMEKVKQIAPQASSQADQFIEQIKSGKIQ